MAKTSNPGGRFDVDAFFARNAVVSLDRWAETLGGRNAAVRARAMARYYSGTGRLRRITRGLYAVVPPGTDPRRFVPDPYLVAAALRDDAVLSHHSALELLGVARSVFHRYTYLSAQVRRPLRAAGLEWRALAFPRALVRARQQNFGVVSIDRRGVLLRVTGPERTLVDGFSGSSWVGGLEEHVDSSAAFRDLEFGRLFEYLSLLGKGVLFAAVGWFLETHPDTWAAADDALGQLRGRVPRQPLYLAARRRGAALVPGWNILVPPHLAAQRAFEGVQP